MISSKQPKIGIYSAVYFLAGSLLIMPPSLFAQDVDEMIVTVRKKEENLQDVPLSVTALSATEIEKKGIADITDVAQYTASIQFKESFAQSDTRIAIRGLSPTRGRQNVAVLLDGIDVSSEAITSAGGSILLNTNLVDVQRIEVLEYLDLAGSVYLYGPPSTSTGSVTVKEKSILSPLLFRSKVIVVSVQ